jgi:putative transposase
LPPSPQPWSREFTQEIKEQQIFPADEAAFKLVYLAIRNISKKWTMPIKDWKLALNRFAIEFEGRLCT